MDKIHISAFIFCLALLFSLTSDAGEKQGVVKEGVIEYVENFDEYAPIMIRFSDEGRQLYWRYGPESSWEEGDHVSLTFDPVQYEQTVQNISKGVTEELEYIGWVSPENYQVVKIEVLFISEYFPGGDLWNITLSDGSKWAIGHDGDSLDLQEGDDVVMLISIYDTPEVSLKDFLNNPFPLQSILLDDDGAAEKMGYIVNWKQGDPLPPSPWQFRAQEVRFFKVERH